MISHIPAPDFIKDIYSWAKSVYVFTYRLEHLNLSCGYNVARSGLGADYHHVLADLMNIYIAENISCDVRYAIVVDSQSFDEKKLAAMAGMGCICKNNLLYSKVDQCFPVIGEIITDVPLSGSFVTDYINTDCSSCDLCQHMCPTSAIADFSYNKYACISYINQKSGVLSLNEMLAMGDNIYGCDICQRVCPLFNINKCDDSGLPGLESLVRMNTEEYKNIKGRYPFAWIGRNRLRRNALICSYNTNKDLFMNLLSFILNDNSEILVKTAEILLSDYKKKKTDKI